MRTRGRRGWAASVLAAAALQGCAGPRQMVHREVSQPVRPAWVSRVPRQAGLLYVVGVAADLPSLAEARRAAQTAAAAEAAAVLGTSVQAELRSRDSTTPGASVTEEVVRARVRALVTGLRVEDEYTEHTRREVGRLVEHEYSVYVLGAISLEDLEASTVRSRAAAEATLLELEGTAEEIARLRAVDPLEALRRARSGGSTAASLVVDDGSSTRRLLQVQARLREVETDLRAVSRLVRVSLDGAGGDAAALVPIIEESIPSPLTATDGAARFHASVRLRPRGQGRLYAQRSIEAAFEVGVVDAWRSGARVATETGRVRGFGRTLEDAYRDAVRKAVKRVSVALWRRVIEEHEAALVP